MKEIVLVFGRFSFNDNKMLSAETLIHKNGKYEFIETEAIQYIEELSKLDSKRTDDKKFYYRIEKYYTSI